jgi:hypothetical protein
MRALQVRITLEETLRLKVMCEPHRTWKGGPDYSYVSELSEPHRSISTVCRPYNDTLDPTGPASTTSTTGASDTMTWEPTQAHE